MQHSSDRGFNIDPFKSETMKRQRHKSKPRQANGFSSWSIALLKIGCAAVVICLIGFSIAVFEKDGTVAESQADVFDFSFGQKPNQVRFHESLESMGHPEPQVFDLNGNLIHFSVNYLPYDPPEIMRRYQETFVHKGLNDRIYDTVDSQSYTESLEARMTGGITPVEIGPQRIIMAGMLTHNRALDVDDLTGDLLQVRDMDRFRGYRWIEILREPGADQSTVLASWSDEDFSYEKMLPEYNNRPGIHGRSVDPDVPSCPGCTRVNHFADKKDSRGYRSNIFVTSMGREQMVSFYHRAMIQRGWQETEFQQAQEKLQRSIPYSGDKMKKLSFEDGERHLKIFVFPLDSGEIAVQTVLWEQLE